MKQEPPLASCPRLLFLLLLPYLLTVAVATQPPVHGVPEVAVRRHRISTPTLGADLEDDFVPTQKLEDAGLHAVLHAAVPDVVEPQAEQTLDQPGARHGTDGRLRFGVPYHAPIQGPLLDFVKSGLDAI